MARSPDALPELPVADAAGETLAIYNSIEAALGVRLVNLVYRHLATVPGALEWAWGTVGEAFADGEVAAAAVSVMEALADAAPDAATLSLSGAGLADDEAAAVRATLDAYNRANPMNAVALQVIALALRAGRAATRPNPTPPDVSGLPALLPIAPLDRLDAETAEVLADLARQATGARSPVVPSLFRHFTAWPDLLRAISDWLEPLASAGAVDALSAEIFRAADDAAAGVLARLPAAGADAFVPDAQTRAALLQTIAVFPPAICRMIVLGGMLRGALRD